MLNKFLKVAGAAATLILGGMVSAQAWTLDNDASKLAYGSIKKNAIGEVNSFDRLSGTVSKDGNVSVEIDLTSVQTNIDIRNERMGEHVFKNAPKALLSAKVDMTALEAVEVGKSKVMDVEGKISLGGAEVEIEAEMLVVRLSETKVMVTTNDMIFVSTADLGITEGIDKLMALAKLPSITRTAPVVLRLVFNNSAQKVEATPAATTTASTETPAATAVAAVTGDVELGKKVFRRCKACHAVKVGKNGVGPTLHGILNAKAGANPDYKYSKAMAESGLTWDMETLSAFLAKPKKTVKGTKMAFAGLRKDKDIQNVIAYIVSQSN